VFKTFSDISSDIRQQLIATFIVGILFWSSLASQLPVIPLYIQHLGGSTVQIGLVMGSFAIGLLLCRSYLGRLADSKGRIAMITLGLLVAAVVPLFYAALPSIPALSLCRAFHGVSIGAFATAYSALISDLAPPRHRGEIIGYMSLVNPLGMGLGAALGGWLQAEWGYVPIFVVASSLAILGLIVTRKLHETPDFLQSKIHQHHRLTQRFWPTLTSPRVRVPALVLFLIGLIFGTVISFLPLLMKEQQLPLNVGLFYMATAIAGLMIRLPIARFSDRWGRGLFISIGICFYLLSMVVICLATNGAAFVGAGILEGIGSGILIPAVVALLADRTVPEERGFVFGLAWVGFDLGMALAGPLMGSMIIFVGLKGAFAIAVGLALLALIIFITQSSHNLADSMRFAIGRAVDQYATS